jgi:alkanesulfonate monooxygenase SsuD/methylene tetrahydromethanopterin reductase-like flavin-dependent oxidoreductase (luciferase family)
MEALAIGVREHLATPVPLVIGAMSRRGLAVAARHADIVAFAGLRITPAGFAMSGPEETDAAIAQVRNAAAGRPYRSDVLLQAVTVEGDPRAQAAAWAPEMDVDALLASPYALFAPDPASARAELEHRRTRWGFDCFMTHAPHLEALGAVIAAG